MGKSAKMTDRLYRTASTIVKYASYALMAGIIFGAWPVLFFNDPGRVAPADWERAKVWSVIILVIDFVVFFGIMALDKLMAKRLRYEA